MLLELTQIHKNYAEESSFRENKIVINSAYISSFKSSGDNSIITIGSKQELIKIKESYEYLKNVLMKPQPNNTKKVEREDLIDLSEK